jgi:hypothetical protein
MLTVSRFAIDAHRSPHISAVEVQIACTDAECMVLRAAKWSVCK